MDINPDVHSDQRHCSWALPAHFTVIIMWVSLVLGWQVLPNFWSLYIFVLLLFLFTKFPQAFSIFLLHCHNDATQVNYTTLARVSCFLHWNFSCFEKPLQWIELYFNKTGQKNLLLTAFSSSENMLNNTSHCHTQNCWVYCHWDFFRYTFLQVLIMCNGRKIHGSAVCSTCWKVDKNLFICFLLLTYIKYEY